MKIRAAAQDVAHVTTWEQLQRYAGDALSQIIDVCNGKLNFGDNLESSQVSFAFAAANTEYPIPHTFGRVPNGFILIGSTAAMSLYNGTTANTGDRIYLKSSAIGTATFLVI